MGRLLAALIIPEIKVAQARLYPGILWLRGYELAWAEIYPGVGASILGRLRGSRPTDFAEGGRGGS